ncbi:MAG TPA: hypothetical protein VHG52_14830, partial [Thermomicrobiales bacterium]|nr:hypothetical protein [Thermomicrobiales bacterium]
MRSLMLILVALMLVLAACGSEDDDASGDTPDEVLSVETLRERASELDGETVTVRSNYWSNAEGQYLSDIMMESCPPQIPFDQAVILDGEVPQSVLDMLTTADP